MSRCASCGGPVEVPGHDTKCWDCWHTDRRCGWPVAHRYRHACSCTCRLPRDHAGRHACDLDLSRGTPSHQSRVVVPETS